MMKAVEIVVEGYARAPLRATFDTIVPIDLAKIFTGYGPLPAVVGGRDQTAPWNQVGASRVVELSDGSAAREEITAYEAPAYFAYRVGPFSGMLRYVAAHADGAWWFSDNGAGRTHIRWSYRFALAGPAAPLARLAIPPLWRAYARQVLVRAIAEAEAARV
jgi:hypothetical protein